MINMKVLGDRVLIKIKKHQEVSEGGIILPDSIEESFSEGEIVNIGDKVTLADIKIGDHVLYTKYTGSEQDFGGEKYVIVGEDDIEGIFE
jgi:chaperonin GroES